MNVNKPFLLVISLFTAVSCSTSEQVSRQPDGPEISEEASKREKVIPEWFQENKTGYMEDNKIYSMGLASDTNEETARELAISQSDANLRTQLDYLFEKARIELVENNETSADTPEMIKILRNSIQNINLEKNAAIQTDFHTTEGNIVIAFVQKSLTIEQAKNRLRVEISEHKNLNRLFDTEILN